MTRKNDIISGVLIVNKHSGVTSHRIISSVRKLYDTQRVGHTGTLDPMATGVLPVLLGRAAKASDYLMMHDKEYVCEMKLGITTDTEDITGQVIETSCVIPDEERVYEACRSFVGKISQIPPMYSALKVDGRKLVDMARAGIHGVLHQFLYDTGRTLYHLTGRYLVGHGIGQELDNIRHTLTFELCLFWRSLSRAFHRHFLSVVVASPRRQAISAKEAHGAATP